MDTRFSDGVKAWAAKTKKRTDLVFKKSIELLAEELIERSPVGDPATWQHPAPKDYEPGTFKANWQGGDGEINFTITDDKDITGEISFISIMSKVPDHFEEGTPFYITNSLPYSIALENGWSSQAPAGIVSLTRLNWQNIVNIAATSVIGGAVT